MKIFSVFLMIFGVVHFIVHFISEMRTDNFLTKIYATDNQILGLIIAVFGYLLFRR